MRPHDIDACYSYSLQLPCLGKMHFSCFKICSGQHGCFICDISDLQEVDAAGTGRWSDPDEAEAGGGLVADVGGDHAADKLGSTELTLRHHTCG